jgi:hypothetical protein
MELQIIAAFIVDVRKGPTTIIITARMGVLCLPFSL